MEKRLLKYARMAVPRYTSYPTAVQFHERVGSTDYQGWLKKMTPEKPISLYVHIPFCQTLCWYCGCHTTVPNSYDRVASYLQALETEIELTAENIDPEVTVSHLHFGGGTPSYLKSDDFKRLVSTIKQNFNFQEDAELAVESDPRTLSDEIIVTFANCGITRVSLGVQDFDPKVQALINRFQPVELVTDSVMKLKAMGIAAINFDLMYGLPGQTVECAQTSAEIAGGMRPNRIAVFGYAHVPWFKKHQSIIKTELLPGIEERIEQSDAIAEKLVEMGYIRIGLDHFALPEDELSIALAGNFLRRNFQGYTTDTAETLIGFGTSSISTLPDGYCQNDPHIGRYITKANSRNFTITRGVALNDEDKLRRQAINQLMCTFSLDLAKLAQEFQKDPDVFSETISSLKQLEVDGLIEIKGLSLKVLPQGRRFIRNIAACFDQHLLQDNKKHSLAV